MITIGLAYLLTAVAASVLFIIAGWRTKRLQTKIAARARSSYPAGPLPGEAGTSTNEMDAEADTGLALRTALERVAPMIASQSVHAAVVAPAGLRARMGTAVLVELLEELVAAAVRCAPTRRLLLTAASAGDCIQVAITDDLPGADAANRLASVRGLMDRLARRGGALDVQVKPHEGTTMTVRLIAAGTGATDNRSEASIRPAER